MFQIKASLNVIFDFCGIKKVVRISASWQDFATQVRHSRVYQHCCKADEKEPGRFLSPSVGEWVSGLRLNCFPNHVSISHYPCALFEASLQIQTTLSRGV